MEFEYEQPTSEEGTNVGGGGVFLSKPGFYHVIVMYQTTQPTNFSKTKFIDGLGVVFGVLAGSHADQLNKTLDVIFIKGSKQHSDGGELCNRKLSKLFAATGLKTTIEPGQPARLDTTQLVNPPRQLIIKTVEKPNSNNPGKMHIELSYDDIWHVDDPAVKDVPKNAEALAAIPAALRRDPSTFKSVKPADGAGSGAEPAKPRISPSALLAAPVAAAVASPAPSAAPVDVSAI